MDRRFGPCFHVPGHLGNLSSTGSTPGLARFGASGWQLLCQGPPERGGGKLPVPALTHLGVCVKIGVTPKMYCVFGCFGFHLSPSLCSQHAVLRIPQQAFLDHCKELSLADSGKSDMSFNQNGDAPKINRRFPVGSPSCGGPRAKICWGASGVSLKKAGGSCGKSPKKIWGTQKRSQSVLSIVVLQLHPNPPKKPFSGFFYYTPTKKKLLWAIQIKDPWWKYHVFPPLQPRSTPVNSFEAGCMGISQPRAYGPGFVRGRASLEKPTAECEAWLLYGFAWDALGEHIDRLLISAPVQPSESCRSRPDEQAWSWRIHATPESSCPVRGACFAISGWCFIVAIWSRIFGL